MKSYPIKSHGKKTTILPYAFNDLIEKFELPADVFENKWLRRLEQSKFLAFKT